MAEIVQSQEDVYCTFKRKLQQLFNKEFQSERKQQYFDAFFNISSACREFKKELFLIGNTLDKQKVESVISNHFELANYEICTNATRFFREKGVQ